MHRFFVPPHWIHGDRLTFRDHIAHQLRSVLRMQPGDCVMALDNQGCAFTVRLDQVTRDQATGTIIERAPATGEPPIAITLYPCALKKDNFEWVLQKGTEIGVSAFVPVLSQRTVIPEIKAAKQERWERIITEAAEQSRRGLCPALYPPLAFAEAVQQASACDLALIPYEGESTRGLRSALIPYRGRADLTVALIIGPEGGFTPDEIALAAQHGIAAVSLGPRILRAETAAITAAALLIYELDGS